MMFSILTHIFHFLQLPEILRKFQGPDWKAFLAAHCGILLGFGIMLVIAIFEEQIRI